VNSLTQSNATLESKLKSTTAMLQTERNTSATLLKERDQYKEELTAVRAQLIDVQEELETHKTMLANETVARVDFENKLQSAKEEIELNKKIHAEELSEARRISTFKVSEVSNTIKANYESKLEATVIDLREQHSLELDQMRDDLENEYTSKIEALSNDLESAKGFEAGLRAAEMKKDSLKKTVQQLQMQINNLTNRAQDLESDVQAERNLRISEVGAAQKERDEVKEKIAAIQLEYNDLMDLKLKLDHEIGVYRKLLEEEELRLNMSPSPMVPGASSSRRRHLKRKRKADKKSDDEGAKKQCGPEEVLHEAPQAGPEGTNNCALM
jgi:DNA repair exonuclease SbcCD ATPase subunit